MYAKSGLLASSREVFDNLRVRDVISWTTLIIGFYEYGDDEEALNCFNKMQIEGVSPNTHTMVCILRACGSMVDVGNGLEIHAHMEKKGWLDSDVAVGTALLDMFVKCGLLPEAHKIFSTLHFRDVVSWTTLIGGFVQFGHAAEALELFDKMRIEGITPDAISFFYALKACNSIQAREKVDEIHIEIETGFFCHVFISR